MLQLTAIPLAGFLELIVAKPYLIFGCTSLGKPGRRQMHDRTVMSAQTPSSRIGTLSCAHETSII
jgi:hypothetical protein